MLLECDGCSVLIDCGIQFPDAAYPGVDLFLPDFSVLLDRLDALKGIVVTHGHDDHIGGIPFLARHKELDVYCTPFPRGLIQERLREFNDAKRITFHEITPRASFRIGPFFFDPIPVQHSIIESLALAIETPAGNLVHSGDFKHDPAEYKGGQSGFEALEEWGKKGVSLLFSDSTNAERTGHTLSEETITSSFERFFLEQKGRIIIALFASNIRRIENLLRLAKKLKKRIALAGRSMHSYTKLAHEQSSLDIPEDTLVLLENIHEVPDQDLIVLATGSQAEPQSALVRIASGMHKDISIQSGDLVLLSSRFIPGNEKAITSMIDHLYRAGAEVVYESIHQIHVSGHGFQDELRMMLCSVRPKFFIPIHGEYRHLAKHAVLARQNDVAPENVFVIEDGQAIELSSDRVVMGDRLTLNKLPVVNNIVVGGESTTFNQRAKFARAGVVLVVAVYDRKSGELLVPPRISAHAILLQHGYEPASVLEEAIRAFESFFPTFFGKPDLVENVRIEMRRFYKKRASQKPEVIPVLVSIDKH